LDRDYSLVDPSNEYKINLKFEKFKNKETIEKVKKRNSENLRVASKEEL
jgi:hypothetical protein